MQGLQQGGSLANLSARGCECNVGRRRESTKKKTEVTVWESWGPGGLGDVPRGVRVGEDDKASWRKRLRACVCVCVCGFVYLL